MPMQRPQERAPRSPKAGFTLVEMLVAIALFSIVMVVAVGTLLSLAAANKKAQALQSVMNNLNISLDGMVRSLRMGTSFQCLLKNPGPPGNDCKNGGREIAFTCNPVEPSCVPGNRWAYA